MYIYNVKWVQFNRHPNDTPMTPQWHPNDTPMTPQWHPKSQALASKFKPHLSQMGVLHQQTFNYTLEKTRRVYDAWLYDVFVWRVFPRKHECTSYNHLSSSIHIYIYAWFWYIESPRCSSCRDEAKWWKPRYWCPCNADGFTPGLDGWNAHGFVSSTHLFHGQTMVYRVPRHPSNDGSLYNWLWIPMSLCVD